jgi:hypothetical protein
MVNYLEGAYAYSVADIGDQLRFRGALFLRALEQIRQR